MMILRQKARNKFLFLVRKAKHDCSCCAKNWISPFDGHSTLEYDTETDSSTQKPITFRLSETTQKNVYSNIFTYFYVWYIFNTSRAHL